MFLFPVALAVFLVAFFLFRGAAIILLLFLGLNLTRLRRAFSVVVTVASTPASLLGALGLRVLERSDHLREGLLLLIIL